jgi:hypothetical protein
MFSFEFHLSYLSGVVVVAAPVLALDPLASSTIK